MLSAQMGRGRAVVARRTGAGFKRRKIAVLFAATTAAVAAPRLFAATDTWTLAGSGLWSASGNWSGGLPVTSSDVTITTPGSSQNLTVTYDSSVAAANTNVNSITIDTSLSNSLIAFNQSAKTLGITNNMVVGNNGRGVFNESGGTVTLGVWLYVGNNTGSSGTVNLSAGTLNVMTGIEEVGQNGAGVFNDSGGVNNANTLVVGNFIGTGASGTYNMSNGATINISQNLSIGDSGVGNFNMTGGTINFTNVSGGQLIYIADFANSSGTFTLSGGNLNESGPNQSEYVGFSGSGTFIQTGGTNTTGYLALGFNSNGTNPASVGVYTLSNNAIIAGDPEEFVGVSGNGTFNQTGGTNNATIFVVGDSSSAIGAYSMSNNAVLNASAWEYIGKSGSGTFNQTGGTNTTLNLYLGVNSSSGTNPAGTGVYTLSNNAVLNVTSGEYVGNNGNGTFNQTGGSNIAGFLVISSGGSGTYNLLGGVLSTGTALVNAGGVLNANGGTFTSSGLTLAGGSVNVTAGSLSSGTVQVNAGTLNIGGGSLTATTFNQAGGTVSGTLQNTGTFNYSGGSFTGRLVNQGVANLGASFTAGNGIENDVTMTVTNGAAVYANGAGLDNLGTLNMQLGSTLGGSGPLLNDYGGIMNAAGSITGAFTNDGVLNVTGLLSTGGTMTNAGQINISAGQTLRTTGTNVAVSNVAGGVVQGAGAVSSLLNNGGLVYANGASALVVTSLTGNTNGGELRVANNGTLTVVNAFTNGALITLQGSNASFNGGAMTNAGTIQGFGRLTNTVVNAGVIQATGGRLTFSAANITNGPLGQIQVFGSTNVASFTQGLTNAGNVSLGGGTLDTGSALLNNTGQLLGNGTVTAGGILNSGTVSLSDVNSSVTGAFTNNGSLKITSNTTTFYGAVTNNGSIKTTAATARFLAPFVNNGTYTSDPSAQSFTDLTVGNSGALVGGAGDSFTLTGSFHSASTQSQGWNTRGALLAFTAGGGSSVHDMDVGGSEAGGYANNFAWGTLEVGSGQSLDLHDATGDGDAALYTSVLQLYGAPDGTGLGAFVASALDNADASDPVNVFYDASQPGNAYLADGTYALGNGGELAPANPASIPEPATLGLLLASGMGLLARRRRRRM